jgi:hypothetical protein
MINSSDLINSSNLTNSTICNFTTNYSLNNLPWYIALPWILGAIVVYILLGYLTFKWAEAYDWSYESQTFFAIIWPIGATILLISTIVSLFTLPIKISDMQYDLEVIKENLKKGKTK